MSSRFIRARFKGRDDVLRSMGSLASWLLTIFVPILCSTEARATTPTPPAPPAPMTMGGKVPGVGRLELRAARLAYRPRPACKRAKRDAGASATAPCGSDLQLEGGVSLEVGPLSVRASRAHVRIDARGKPSKLEARGAINLRFRDRSGTAEKLTFELSSRRLRLDGAASLRCPDLGFDLSGEQIDIDLAAGGVTVYQARAELKVASHHGR